jgi:outer membrane protein TolC
MATRGNAGLLPTLAITSDLNSSTSDLELVPGSFIQNLMNPQGETQSPPSVEYNGVTTTQFNAGIGTQIVIFDGMKGKVRYRLLQSGRDITGLQHRFEMENTILSVTRQYLQVASLQKAIDVKRLYLEQNLDRYKTIEARREYGRASEQEQLQALADLKSDSSSFRDLKIRYENAYRDLHTSIGWDRRELIPIEEENVRIPERFDYEELLLAMQENNTLLNVRHLRIRNAEIQKELAEAGFLPSLTASAQYGYSYQSATEGLFERQEQLGLSGGISLKIPVFSGGRNQTEVQNARASARQEQLRYEESETELRNRFDNAWQEYLALKNQLAIEQSNLNVFERNYERAVDSFDRGLITSLELRSAQLSLENARLRISEIEFQLIMAQTTLRYLSGSLLQGNRE